MNPHACRAQVRQVHEDGTLTVDFLRDDGRGLLEQKLRLSRIGAEEYAWGAHAWQIRCADFLRSKVLGKSVVVNTFRELLGSGTQHVAELYLQEAPGGEWINLNDQLLEASKLTRKMDPTAVTPSERFLLRS